MALFSDLVGQIITSIVVGENEGDITFKCESGDEFLMHHYIDCCESVYVEDICGEWEDVIGSPILVAEEVSSDNGDIVVGDEEAMNYHRMQAILKKEKFLDTTGQDSITWTFYKLDTNKGGVTIRWVGESNGYYSESVSFDKVE